jgi:hypothetical protein
MEIDLTRTARRQHDCVMCADDLYAARRLVQHVGTVASYALRIRRAADALVVRQQFDGVVIFEDRDIWMMVHRGKQRALHLAARQVVRVYDAVRRVPAFAAEIELPRAVARELCAKLYELSNALRALFNEHPNSIFMAESRPGDQRIADVRLEGVVFVDNARDAALRVIRVRFRTVFLRNDENIQTCQLCSLKGKEESGGAGAKYKDVGARDVS